MSVASENAPAPSTPHRNHQIAQDCAIIEDRGLGPIRAFEANFVDRLIVDLSDLYDKHTDGPGVAPSRADHIVERRGRGVI